MLLSSCQEFICVHTCEHRYNLFNAGVCEGAHCACNMNHTCSQPADCKDTCDLKVRTFITQGLCPNHRCRCVVSQPGCFQELCTNACEMKFYSKRGIKGVCDGDACYCKDPQSGGTMHGPSQLITALVGLTTVVRMPSLGQGMIHALVMPATLLGFVATQLGLGSRVTAV
ncbi:uncharacterized protein LOC144149447 isoform X2 [Haemaphysalis longicornis]